jgi:hypothetical protein
LGNTDAVHTIYIEREIERKRVRHPMSDMLQITLQQKMFCSIVVDAQV